MALRGAFARETLTRQTAQLAGNFMKRLGDYRAVVAGTALAPPGYSSVEKRRPFFEALCRP